MKTKIKSIAQLTLCFFFVVIFQLQSKAGPGDFTWKGGTSTDWGTSSNWLPNGVPSTNDTVTIVTGSNDVELPSNITVKRMIITSGTLDLKGFNLTVSTSALFTSGTIKNGHLIVSNGNEVVFSGTTFLAVVTVNTNTIFLNGSDFNDSLIINKLGISNDNSKGGNKFREYVSLTNSSKGSIVLSDSFADTFEKKLKVKNINVDGGVYLAHRATGNLFKGDVTFYGSNIYSNYYGTAEYRKSIILNCPNGNIYFGSSTGSCSQLSECILALGDSAFSAGVLSIRNFTMSGTEGDLALALTGSATLSFQNGTIINRQVTVSAPSIILSGSRFNNLATFTNTGTASVSGLGGCYFANIATITNNSSSTNTFVMGSSTVDSFAVGAKLQNTKGTFSLNNAVFMDTVYLKNVENSTNSDRFSIASTGSCTFKGNMKIENSVSGFCFGKVSGTSNLASGKTLSFVSGFTGNITLSRFTQSGSTAQSFNFSSTGQKLFLGPGSTFNGNFNFSGHFIILNGTTFNGTVDITKYGTIADTCAGGNVFNSTTVIRDSSSGAYAYLMAYTNPDDFNGNVTFVQKGSGAILYPAYNKNSTFAGNISIVSASQVIFGNNGGKVILDGTGSQTLSSSTAYTVKMKKLQINKASNAFTLAYPLTISDSLFLTKGRIVTDTTNLLSISHGGIVYGGSDTSYVNGPMKKIGNAAFTFAIGSSTFAHPYHPIAITAPSTSTDAYTANYFPTSQTIGTAIDTSIDNLNACQYWKLNRNAGTSKVKVKLGWNNDNCETISPSNFRVTGWDGTKWKDLGNSSTSGDSIQGMVQSVDSLSSINTLTLAFVKCSAFRKSLFVSNVSCPGNNDGSILIQARGGTSNYKYSFVGGRGQNALCQNLGKGKYRIEVLDERGCFLSDSIQVTEPDSIKLTISTLATACGANEGEANILVQGGVGPYTYYWPAIQDTSYRLKNVSAGVYSVMVTDSLGCITNGEARISDSDGPGINIVSQLNPTCFNVSNGSIQIDGADGKTPFSYKWNRFINDTLETLNNVGPGSYPVQITNSSGCITYDTIIVPVLYPYNINFSVTGTPCGTSNGQILASVEGGIRPYVYNWSVSADTDSVVTGLASGIDTLTVTDSIGCVLTKTIELPSTSGFGVTISIIHPVVCFPDSGANVRAIVTGGTSPFSYKWSPIGNDNDTVVNLPPDNYSIVVTDGTGCIAKDTFSLSGPEELEAYIELINPTNDSALDGKALAVVKGGEMPYTFLWSTGATIDSIINIGAGIDSVVVQDNNGCVLSRQIIIGHHPITNLCYGCLAFDPYPDQYCGAFQSPNCPSPCTTLISRNIVSDFHADGTDNLSDECQFEEAASFFNSLPPQAPKELVIPPGIYYIGKQHTSAGYYMAGHSVLCFQNINNLTIKGDKVSRPILRFQDCMKYGVFDVPNNPDNRLLSDGVFTSVACTTATGSNIVSVNSTANLQVGYKFIMSGIPSGSTITAINSILNEVTISNTVSAVYIGYAQAYIGANILSDYSQVAVPGIMIHLNGCFNIKLLNLELDGNIDNCIIGGGWGPGIQQIYDGLFINASQNVTIDNVFAHHFGSDGIRVYYNYCPSSFQGQQLPPVMNMKILNSQFMFNCRNNFTWGGGKGLQVTNSEFSWAGQSRFSSDPGAGMDIEYENSNVGNSDGTFTDCLFRYNLNYGMTNDRGLTSTSNISKNFYFTRCTFVASGTGVSAFPNSKNFNFNNCHFFGPVQKAYSSYLSDRNISYNTNITDNTKFTDCDFNEEYIDPVLGPLSIYPTEDDSQLFWGDPGVCAPVVSFPIDCINGTNTLNCPSHFHELDFPNAVRVQLTNCTVFTKYDLKILHFTTDPPYPVNTASFNTVQNCVFQNEGLNGMFCEGGSTFPLANFWNTDFKIPRSHINFPGAGGSTNFVNYGPPWTCFCFGNTYETAVQNSIGSPPIGVQIGINTTYFPKFENIQDPNPITSFFNYPVYITEPISFPTCTFSPRIKNPHGEKLINLDLMAIPNPSSNEIKILNLIEGESFQVETVTGEILYNKNNSSTEYLLDITKLKAGIYFVHTGKGRSLKFIKISQ